MRSLRARIGQGPPLILPGVNDALSARMAAQAGFEGICVGGSGLSATQLGLPDLGLQSFGEYRDAVARVLEACPLPVMVDGENGFGDVKAVTRTVRAFERMGVSAIAFEDLVFPPRIGRPPAVIPLEEITGKLKAALAARTEGDMLIVGRTDAAQAGDLEEALRRARRFEEIGADAVLLIGLTDLDGMQRLRDTVRIPLIAIVVEDGPWIAPSPEEIARIGFEVAIYPATLLLRAVTAIREGLAAIRTGSTGLPPGSVGYRDLASVLGMADWARIDGPPPG